MGKETAPVWLSIFIVAFIAGILFAVGIKTGTPTDEGGISVLITKEVCKETQNLDNSVTYNCGIFVALMVFLSIIFAIATVAEEAMRMQDWRIGLLIYGVGWFVGLVYMLTHL